MFTTFIRLGVILWSQRNYDQNKVQVTVDAKEQYLERGGYQLTYDNPSATIAL